MTISLESSDRSEQLAQTNRDFSEAFTPPGWIFWDEALARKEHEVIFTKMWVCVGHVSRLAKPGDYFLVNLEPESIIVIADQNGEPNAFFNVCRHRGTRMLHEASGSCRGILCPYHAWRYGLDGKLMAAPNMNDVKDFDKKDFPLHQVRVESFNGFLFINLDPDAAPVAEVYADFPDMTRYGTDDLVRVGHHNYHVDANWKLIVENYHECYHCAPAHPQLHRISEGTDYPEHEAVGEGFTGGPMGIKPEFNTMTLSGTTKNKMLPGLTEEDRSLVFYFNLFPSMLYSLAPDYLLVHYVFPTGPTTCYIETEWFCAPEQMEEPDFSTDDMIEFWHMTNLQDWKLCENAMQGLRSRGHKPGRYNPEESCVHDFDRWYVTTMFGEQTPNR